MNDGVRRGVGERVSGKGKSGSDCGSKWSGIGATVVVGLVTGISVDDVDDRDEVEVVEEDEEEEEEEDDNVGEMLPLLLLVLLFAGD